MAKVVRAEEGRVLGPGTVMWKIWLQGYSEPIQVEVRSDRGMDNLMPPFGIVAIHGVCSLSKEEEAVIEAACGMFQSPKSGIGDLKRAVKEFEGKKYRIYKMMAESHVTDWPSLFKSPDDAARWAIEKDLAADLRLHEYLAVQDETTEKIVRYL